MCYAMENSNHHAQKDIQTKTMRGGGKKYGPDPSFNEVFSYCHYLEIVSKHKRTPVSVTFDKLQKQFEQTTTNMQNGSQACNEINRCHSIFKWAADLTSFSRG